MISPVDPIALCRQHGITVREIPMLETPGHITWDATAGWTIDVRKDDPYNRRRFTVAHELGHFILHLERGARRIDQPLHRDGGECDPRAEREANQFAASLLMPALIVATAWKHGANLEDLARDLQVSRTALEWRLHNLGLVQLY